MKEKQVSIVMCTYNGENFLKEQLDTLVSQTYPIEEIIVQDDHSTDGTMDILRTYAANHPNIKVFTNESERGINGNFFSAMRRAKSDFIAICDQDDLWDSLKIEKQMAAIGNHLLCTCRSKPFSSDGSAVIYDSRTPNYHLIRLLYASIPGHTMVFHRRLLDLLPDLNYDYQTNYDVFLSLTAASYDSLVLVGEFLVHQRRYASAATFVDVDNRRTPSVKNGFYILWWSLCHFHEVRPYMFAHFQRRLHLLEGISAENTSYQDALTIVGLEGKRGFLNMMRLCKMHVKHRHHLFYTKEKGLVNFLRASLYFVMQVYNYQYLLPKNQK